MVKDFLAIAVGGALGASLRAMSYIFFASIPLGGLPWGQIIVNVAGSFLAGVVFYYGESISTEMRSFLMIGFLGSLTTMSAFALDVQQMLQHRLFLQALLLWFSGAFVCILACALGLYLASLSNAS